MMECPFVVLLVRPAAQLTFAIKFLLQGLCFVLPSIRHCHVLMVQDCI